MKKWIKLLLVSMIAIVTTSCGDDDEDYVYERDIYTGSTWSVIYESSDYKLFECYDFYKGGTYEYWFYKNDRTTGEFVCDYEDGYYDVYLYPSHTDIELHGDWGAETYHADKLLEGMCDDNSPSSISYYKTIVKEVLFDIW